MKCACGYEDKTYDDEWNLIAEGDEGEFIRTELQCPVEDSGYYKNINMRSVYACPKCGTLKIERY